MNACCNSNLTTINLYYKEIKTQNAEGFKGITKSSITYIAIDE